MADRRSFLSEGAVTYAYLLLYIALSSGQIFFNKVGFLAPDSFAGATAPPLNDAAFCVSLVDSSDFG